MYTTGATTASVPAAYAKGLQRHNSINEYETKKMKKHRFKNWLRNWLNNIDDSDLRVEKLSISREESLDTDPMVLKIYRASGGTVIETKKYDRQKDRNFNQLHIVTHEQDLGESIGKIITMESLRG